MVVKIFYNTYNVVQGSPFIRPDVKKKLLDQIFFADRDVLTAVKEKTKNEAIIDFKMNKMFFTGSGYTLAAGGEIHIDEFLEAQEKDQERFDELCTEV